MRAYILLALALAACGDGETCRCPSGTVAVPKMGGNTTVALQSGVQCYDPETKATSAPKCE